MIRHHYTLEHIAAELTSRLRGGTLVEAWTQEKFTVAVVVAIGDQLRTFVIDASPNGGSCSEQPNLRRARSNTLDMFRPLWGQPIALVTKHPDDRILSFWFPEHQLHCEFFSSGNGNVVCTHGGMIIEALRDTSARCGTRFDVHAPRAESLWSLPTLTAQQSLARSPLQLGPYYAEEACHRCTIAPSTSVASLSDADQHMLSDAASRLRAECLATTTYYLLARGDVRLLSLTPLNGWNVAETYTSVLAATHATLRERHRIARLHAVRTQALRTATASLAKAQRTLAAITSDNVRDSRSQRYRVWADTLLTYHNQHERDRTSIDLLDVHGAPITIPLNPEATIIENARRLYDKARAAEVASAHREQRIPELERTIRSLEDRIHRIEHATSVAAIEAEQPTPMTEHTDQPRDESSGRFRFFVLDDTHTLYVGKNAANNDELTMKFAKQQDWWLHARGAAGSHAVIRGVEGDRIPKPILEKAAAITAYYSQARNASWVTVVYTQRKHVRKPKGANVGAVVLEREQTVMVKPALPT